MQAILQYSRPVNESITLAPLKSAVGNLIDPGLPCGRFTVKLASSSQELEEVQRLRFRIFNEELGEGIPENAAHGMDRDEFDEYCDHLLLKADGKVVATFRLLYGPRRPDQGFYSESEFKLKNLPIDFNNAVEMGRACIDPAYRKHTTLLTLFWGLHCYMCYRDAQYLMGCGSLSSRNADDAEATFEELKAQNKVVEIAGLEPRPENAFKGDAARGKIEIPQLVNVYFEFGAKIYSRPAYDPVFRCYDLFVMFDMNHLSKWGNDLMLRFDKRLLGGEG